MALAFSDDDEDQLPVSRKRQSLFIESSPASSDKGARRRDEDDDEGDARPAKSRRASRRQQPRFLGDDDDNDAPAGPRGRASTVPDLFADLDDLDDEPAPTAREQDASIRVDDDRRWNEDGGEREADEDGEIKIRQKRVVAKMDEERLLGPSGFPKLQASLATLKLKGKGHEVQDLDRLLSLYQWWAHQMYSKTTFRDVLQSVERLCHKRSVARAMKEYRQAARRGGREPTTEADERAKSRDRSRSPVAERAVTQAPQETAPASRRVTEFPDDDDEFPDDDDFFFGGGGGGHAPAASAAPTSTAPPARTSAPPPPRSVPQDDDDDMFAEEEAMLREMAGEF